MKLAWEKKLEEKAKENEWTPPEDDAEKKPELKDAYPLPEGNVVGDFAEPLYDNSRNHYDQVVLFKKRKGTYRGEEISAQEQEADDLQAEAQQTYHTTKDTLTTQLGALVNGSKPTKAQVLEIGKLFIQAEEHLTKKDFVTLRESLHTIWYGSIRARSLFRNPFCREHVFRE